VRTAACTWSTTANDKAAQLNIVLAIALPNFFFCFRFIIFG